MGIFLLGGESWVWVVGVGLDPMPVKKRELKEEKVEVEVPNVWGS